MIVYVVTVNLYSLIRISNGVKHLMREIKNKGFSLRYLIFLEKIINTKQEINVRTQLRNQRH